MTEEQHVGWVERGETHQPNAEIDGFRSSTHPTGLPGSSIDTKIHKIVSL